MKKQKECINCIFHGFDDDLKEICFQGNVLQKFDGSEEYCDDCMDERLYDYVSEWLDKMDKWYTDGKSTDTFTQMYYDKFCDAMQRKNNR